VATNGFTVNGEYFTVADSALQRSITDVIFGVHGTTSAEVRLEDLSQTAPAGRFGVKIDDDTFTIRRATSTTSDPYAESLDLLTITQYGAEFGVPLAVTNVAPLVANMVEVLPANLVQKLAWFQGHGPTEDPDGYVLIHVGVNKLGIIPYWDYRG